MDADLRTDRLALLPLPPAAAALVTDRRDDAAAELGVELSLDWPLRERLAAVRAQTSITPDQAAWGMWVIVDDEDQLVVGDIGFSGRPSRKRSVEIDYSVVPSRRGRGYAAEAAAALTAWALGQPGVEVVVAGCELDNIASIRTLRRAGFTKTAQTEIEIRWSRRRT
jgi:RimJ/RimL family protein N-acetyltransferase